MDFSHFQNIMEPNNFARLYKLDKYNPNSLFSFVKKYPKIIDLMLQYFKVNSKIINKYNGFLESSLLMNAVIYNLAKFKNICELNINVNYCTTHNWTALTYAMFINNMNAAKVLLEYDVTTIMIRKWKETYSKCRKFENEGKVTTMVRKYKIP